MADEGKKVSFGFAKSIKKSSLKIIPPQEEKKVDYIECIDEKSIKVVGAEEKDEGPLIIPLLGSKTWHDRILNKTDADIFEPKTRDKEIGVDSNVSNGNGNINSDGIVVMDLSEIKKEQPDGSEAVPKSLEELAASEIMNDLHSTDIKVEVSDMSLPIAENESLRGTVESTLEDYEQIPIDVFGLAMLRGMGWKPGKGIGKNEKLVTASLPELRPRGMGLGADKATLQKQNAKANTKDEVQLKLEKGSYVKIIGGKHMNNYGQIQCFDDDAGRIMVKMALSGESQSLNECLVQPVTKVEYSKNSKVLNAKQFEEYKQRSENNGQESVCVELSDSEISDSDITRSRREERRKSSKSAKKLKKRSKYTSDESSNESHQISRKRRDSNSSEHDYRHKRTKKSKKSHRRDSSEERSSKKRKKRDKEKERTRERKNEYAESSDRRKHKKHKRSHSRSPARR